MRIFKLTVLCLAVVLGFASCKFEPTYTEAADNAIDSSLNYLEEDTDTETKVRNIKSMYSYTELPDLTDAMVEELISYYGTSRHTSKTSMGKINRESISFGLALRVVQASYDVQVQDGEIFRFAVIVSYVNSFDANDVGVLCLSVIKKSDDPNQENTYWGPMEPTVMDVGIPYVDDGAGED